MRQSKKRRRNRRQWPIKMARVKMRMAQFFVATVVAFGLLMIAGGILKAYGLDQFIEQQIQRLEARARR